MLRAHRRGHRGERKAAQCGIQRRRDAFCAVIPGACTEFIDCLVKPVQGNNAVNPQCQNRKQQILSKRKICQFLSLCHSWFPPGIIHRRSAIGTDFPPVLQFFPTISTKHFLLLLLYFIFQIFSAVSFPCVFH